MARVISIHEYDLKPRCGRSCVRAGCPACGAAWPFRPRGPRRASFLEGIKGVNRYNPVDPPFSKNAPLRPARGLRRGVSFLCWPQTAVSVSCSSRTRIEVSASSVGFSSSGLRVSLTDSRFGRGPSISTAAKLPSGVRSTRMRLFDTATDVGSAVIWADRCRNSDRGGWRQ
jgi:hypothetical protein